MAKTTRVIDCIRWLVFGLLLLGFIGFFYFGGYRYLSFESLQGHSTQLEVLVAENLALMWLLYVVIFFIAAALCLPSLLFLMVVGGFLFGILPSFIAIVLAEFFAAMLVFSIVGTTVGSEMTKFVPAWLLARLQQKNPIITASYLIFLRMMPVAPFGVINIGAGILHISPRLFALTTFFGIMPEAVLYSLVGIDLKRLLEQGEINTWSLMLTPSIFWPLCIAALLALFPVIYVHLRRMIHNGKSMR